MDSKLTEKALFAIEALKERLKKAEAELDAKEQELELQKQAQVLVFSMFKKGSLAAEDLESTIQEYSTKGQEELAILEKVAELGPGQTFKIGRVSDREVPESLGPILGWLLTEEY